MIKNLENHKNTFIEDNASLSINQCQNSGNLIESIIIHFKNDSNLKNLLNNYPSTPERDNFKENKKLNSNILSDNFIKLQNENFLNFKTNQ